MPPESDSRASSQKPHQTINQISKNLEANDVEMRLVNAQSEQMEAEKSLVSSVSEDLLLGDRKSSSLHE